MSSPPSTSPPPAAPFSKGLFLGLAFITTIAVALAVFTAVRALNPSPAPALTPIAQRQPFSFSMPTIDGNTWSLPDHAGRVVLLNYFATWCPPCREEFPDLKKIHAAYASRNVDFAAIGLDQDADKNRPRTDLLADFNTDQRLPFPILLPPTDSPLLNSDTPFAIPQTLLLDRHGRVALHITGRIDPATLPTYLDQLLKE